MTTAQKIQRVTASCCFVFLACSTAHGGNLSCYQDPVTDAMQCVDTTAVREVETAIRATRFYSGGPNRVRDTNMTIQTNCVTGNTHLKDRDGVSFAGGTGQETAALRALRKIICEAPLTPTKRKK